MSTYLSSLIEPVVRRFSSAQQSDEPIPSTLQLSHESAESHAATTQTTHISDHERSSVLPVAAHDAQSSSHVLDGADPTTPERSEPRAIPLNQSSGRATSDVAAFASEDTQGLYTTAVDIPSSENTIQIQGAGRSTSMHAARAEDVRMTDSLETSEAGSLATSPPSSAMARRILGVDRDGPRSSRNRAAMAAILSGSLPADDGMSDLRKQIHDIRDMATSSEEKARRLHSLMMERYMANNSQLTRAQSPASMLSGDRPFTPSSPMSFDNVENLPHSPASMPDNFDPKNPYNLTEDDKESCFRPPRSRRPSIDYEYYHADDNDVPESSEPQLGCRHYKRNVKIQCFDCKSWYPCRHCHDEQETSHHLQRRKTENMFCMLCKTPQPAAEVCQNCEHTTAYYYCDICKLWDDDASKRIYHCADCGICRRGEGIGKDFVHCKVRISRYSV